MGDKPGRYWDCREAGWVTYPAPEPARLPDQPVARDDQLPRTAEADVRSG